MNIKSERVNLALNKSVLDSLLVLSKKKKKTITTITREMVELGLELEEDKALSKIADERIAKTKKWIPHEEFWKFLDE
jgi:predicted DNA-binding protein